jgi:hypothetical protein
MLYREIIAVCSEMHTKHINALCGQKVEFVNVDRQMCVPLFPLPHQLLAQHLDVRNKTFGFINCCVQYKPRAVPDVLHRLNVSVFTDYPAQHVCLSVCLSLFVILNLTPQITFYEHKTLPTPLTQFSSTPCMCAVCNCISSHYHIFKLFQSMYFPYTHTKLKL